MNTEKLLTRERYHNHILSWLTTDKTVLFLQGARGSGKTQIMRMLHDEVQTHGTSSYFFSFEDTIFLQTFDSVNAFLEYRGLKRGIHPDDTAIIFLDEVQYQPNLLALLLELHTQNRTNRKIIVSTHILPADVQRHRLSAITVHPLSFYEYLSYLGFHTTYLKLDSYSKVVGHELRQKQQLFLTWGGYPSITCTRSEQEKRHVWEELLEKMIDKDVKFVFTGRDISDFEKTFLLLLRDQPLPLKIGNFSKQLGIPRNRMQSFVTFMIQYNILLELPVFAPNTEHYLTNLPMLIARDVGLVSFLSENYGEKRHLYSYQFCFVYNELLKVLSTTKRRISYVKKKNGTSIDLFIYDEPAKKGYALLLRPQNSAFHPKVITSDILPPDRTIERVGISQHFFQEKKDNYRIIPAYMIESLAREIVGNQEIL